MRVLILQPWGSPQHRDSVIIGSCEFQKLVLDVGVETEVVLARGLLVCAAHHRSNTGLAVRKRWRVEEHGFDLLSARRYRHRSLICFF